MQIEAWHGISMRMSLVATDSTLVGTGTYNTSTESGGTARITGYVFWQDEAFVPSGNMMPAHPVVVLALTLDNGLSARLDQAVLQGQDTLRGALTFSDEASATYGTMFVRAAR